MSSVRSTSLVLCALPAAVLCLLGAAPAGAKKGPAASIAGATVTEGSGGASNALFRVGLTRRAPKRLVLNWAVVPGSATPGSDFGSSSGTVAIKRRRKAGMIQVPVISDSTDELDESFQVVISKGARAKGMRLRVPTATGTIVDDDPGPTVSVGDLSTPDPVFDPTTVEFPVSLSAPSSLPISVSYSSGAAGDTATAVAFDYQSVTGTLEFPPGQVTAGVQVSVNPFLGALTAEPVESFTLALGSPVNASLGDGDGTATITTADQSPCPDEFFSTTPSLNNALFRFGNLCPGDASDSYSLSMGANAFWRMYLVPMNTDDDPDFGNLVGTPVVGGSGNLGPGQTEHLDFATCFQPSASFTVPVIRGPAHSPERAEGYGILASPMSCP